MAFTTKTRYGAMEQYPDTADVPAVVESLIHELETEQFDEPDDEHYQVAIGYGDWGVTVTVYGLMILDDVRHESDRPALYKRATSRGEAARLLTLMARGDIEAVRLVGWTAWDQVPTYERALFRQPRGTES